MRADGFKPNTEAAAATPTSHRPPLTLTLTIALTLTLTVALTMDLALTLN